MESSRAQPSSEVLRIATLAAASMAVLPPTPPTVNSTFDVQFFGPTVQCSLANVSQQPAFNSYAKSMANSSVMKVTKSLFESGKLRWSDGVLPENDAPLMNVYSAFSPFSGNEGWLEPVRGPTGDPIDEYNNWMPDIPGEQLLPEQLLPTTGVGIQFGQQLWIQTADQGIVCTLGNASFSVKFEFVNAVQIKAECSILNFEPFWIPDAAWATVSVSDPEPSSVPPANSFVSVYLAFSSLLNGNVSTTLDLPEYFHTRDSFDGQVSIYDGTSRIL